MAARVEGMRRNERAVELLDDLIVVFLVGAFGGIGLSFAVRANHTIVPQVLRAASSAALGLLTGLAARQALRRRTGGLRAAAAVAAHGLGLYFLGWFSAEQAGLALPRAVRLAPDWGGLLQIALGAISAVLILRAWPRPADAATGSPGVADRAAGAARPRATRGRENRGSTGRRREHRASATLDRATRTSTAGSRRSASTRIRPAMRSLRDLPARLPRPGRLRNLFLRRGRSVRLVGAQQHRCPYCLEPVISGDPRGVVKCRVCHTPHHADCWAVTKVCQIPHYHR